jgi:hypothetical protein
MARNELSFFFFQVLHVLTLLYQLPWETYRLFEDANQNSSDIWFGMVIVGLEYPNIWVSANSKHPK